jgi:hypothetical protein
VGVVNTNKSRLQSATEEALATRLRREGGCGVMKSRAGMMTAAEKRKPQSGDAVSAGGASPG